MQNHKRQDWNNLAIKTAHVLKSEGVFELKYLFSLEHLEIPMLFRKLSCLCHESVHYQTTKFTKIKINNVYCDIAGPLSHWGYTCNVYRNIEERRDALQWV